MKKACQLTFAVLVCLLLVKAAEARGYVIAQGGNCVTVTFHYDAQGSFIGTSTFTGGCSTMPDGVYPFDLVMNPEIKDPIPLNPTTRKPLTKRDIFYTGSLQILEAVRVFDQSDSNRRRPPVTLPREYARVIEKG